MKTAPIINVTSAATASSPGRVGSGHSSDQSFGQILSHQVNSNNAAGNASGASGNGNANNQQANAASSGNGASSASGAADAGSTSKTGKAKSDGKDDDQSSNANSTSSAAQPNSDPAANSSAQILALVGNIQLPGSGVDNGTTATDTGALPAAAISGITASSAQSALNNFQASVASNAGGLPQVAANTNADLSDLPADSLNETQLTASNSDNPTSAESADKSKIGQEVKDLKIDTTAKTEVATQPVLDLSTAAEKDVQTGLAALDATAAKAAQDAQPATPTAIPAVVAPATVLNTQAVPSGEDKLTPQVGSSGWNQALGQKVVWMVAGGQQSASLTLNPPDLGPMQVVLNVTNSHATATFTAAQPEVRQALEAAMPKLREMLGDAGIQLGQTSVNSGSAQQQQFSERNARATGNSGTIGGDMTDTPISAVSRSTANSAGVGLVDTFA